MIYHQTEHGVLYHGDCLDILPTFADKSVDLVLTDPPYGIDYNNGARNRPNESLYCDIVNDDGDFNYAKLFMLTDRLSDKLIVFGAENFYSFLPHRGRWICWDKRLCVNADKMLGSAFELAWSNQNTGYYKMYRVLHGGVVNADGFGKRFHPTQKPITLFSAIILDYSEPNQLVCDPFAGSGTTAISCIQTNRKYILIEKEEKYCEIAAKRIETALDQTDIFRETK